jgi:hypothetical protein
VNGCAYSGDWYVSVKRTRGRTMSPKIHSVRCGQRMRRGDMPAVVHADGTKYRVMSQDQNTGRSNSKKTDNSSLERVVELKYIWKQS